MLPETQTVVATGRPAETRDVQPYVGPRPFEERDAFRFFGRDREASELVSLVLSHRAVLLYAQSGAGKSSLINAQLMPALRDPEKCQVLLARVQGPSQGVDLDRLRNVYVFHTLMSWAGKDAEPAALARFTLSDYLEQRKREHQAEHADSWDELALPAPWVAVFDQFEELFTYYPHYWRHRKDFFEQVREAFHKDPQLRVLFAMREDHIAALDPFVALLPEKLRTRYRLERLREQTALAAVNGPVQNTGRRFGKGVAEALVRNLLRMETVGPEGRHEVIEEYVEPVQLQVVCQGLWRSLRRDETEITLGHVQECGDVNQALFEFYEQCLARVVQETHVQEQDLRQWFGDYLITPAGTRGMVFADEKEAEGMPRGVVELLGNLYLLRREPRGGASWYELTHDRLVGLIQKSNLEWFQKRDIKLLSERERQKAEQRVQRQIRRRMAVGLVLALILASVALVGWGYAIQQRHEVEKLRQGEKDARVRAENLAQRVQVDRAVAEGTRLFELEDISGSLVWLAQGRLMEKDTSRQAIHDMRLGGTLGQLPRLSHLFAHNELNHADFNQDGRLVLTVGDEAAHVWEVSSGRNLGTFRHEDPPGRVTHAALSRDGRVLVTVGDVKETNGGAAWVWSVPDQKRLRPLPHNSPVTLVCFNPVKEHLVLTVASKEKGAQAPPVPAASTVGFVGTPLGQGPFLASSALVPGISDAQGKVRLWDTQTGRLVADLSHDNGEEITYAAFSPDGSRVVTASRTQWGKRGQAKVWDMSVFGQPLLLKTLSHDGPVTYAAFSPPDGRFVVTTSGPLPARIAQVWSLQTNRPTILPHWGGVMSAAFSPDGSLVVTAGHDATARVWRWLGTDNWGSPSGHPAPTLTLSHGSSVYQAAFSPDGRHVVTAGRDKSVRVWDLSTGKMVLAPLPHNGTVGQAFFHPDGRHVLAIGPNMAQVWATPTGPDSAPLLPAAWVNHVAWSPDGQWVVASCGEPGSSEGKAVLWDATAPSWKPKWTLEHQGAVWHAAFSKDCGRLVTASELDKGTRGVARLWDLTTGKPADEEYLYPHGPLTLAAFAPQNQLVTISRLDGGKRGRAQIWELGQPKPLHEFAHENVSDDDEEGNGLTYAAVSAKGDRLVTTSVDDKAWVWDIRTGKGIGPLKHTADVTHAASGKGIGPLKHTADVTHAAFDSEGQLVATASKDQTLRIWSTETGKLLATQEHSGAVLFTAFAPDNRLVTACQDGSARIWSLSSSDASLGKNSLVLELVAILKHTGELHQALFHENGSHLLTISYTDFRTDPSAGHSPHLSIRPQQWDVAPYKRNAADLLSFGEVVSSREYTGPLLGLQSVNGKDLQNRWQRFKDDPRGFPVGWAPVSSDPATTWACMQRRAEECEEAKQWFAATWYLTRMIEQKEEAALYLRRGKAYASLSQWHRQALNDLNRATELAPEDWRIWQSRAQFHVQARPPDWHRALADYTKAMNLVLASKLESEAKDLWQSRAKAYGMLRQWQAAVTDYSKAIELEPPTSPKGIAELRIQRAKAYAELGQWPEAEEDFSEAMRLGSRDYNLWYWLAVVQLARKNYEGYRKTCQDMMRLFGSTSGSVIAANQVAWTGALDSRSGVSGAELVRLADWAARWYWRQQPYLNTLGAAHFRAKEYDKAVRRLEEAREAFIHEQERLDANTRPSQQQRLGTDGTVWDWIFLAMAHHQLGNEEEARKWLDKATPLVDQASSEKSGTYAGAPLMWNNRVELRLLYREAEQLLGPRSP